jgi:protein-S-isoprenylcysteine O-methyltransferase Ste14
VVFYGWLASEVVVSMILPRLRQYRSGVKPVKSDRGSGLVIITGILLAIIIAFTFSRQKIALLPEWTFYHGIALMIGGVFVRPWSIAILGRFFSMLVSVQKVQPIIREEPCRYIRHSSCTGAILVLMGSGLAIQSWGAVLILVLMSGIVYGYRIRVEEKALAENRGKEYIACMKDTKMLIPFLF